MQKRLDPETGVYKPFENVICKRVNYPPLKEFIIRSQAPSLRLLGRSIFREGGIVPCLHF